MLKKTAGYGLGKLEQSWSKAGAAPLPPCSPAAAPKGWCVQKGGPGGAATRLLWPWSGSAVNSAVIVKCVGNYCIDNHKMSLSVGLHMYFKGF